MLPIALGILLTLIAGCSIVAPTSSPNAPPAYVPAPPPPPLPNAHQMMHAPTEANASLATLTISSGSLDQYFQPGLTEYTSTQGFLVSHLRITAQANDERAAVSIAGFASTIGKMSTRVALAVGDNSFHITVTAADGVTKRDYRVDISRSDASTLAQLVYAKASNTSANDLFGYALALHGDTLAVGAYLEDSFTGGVDGDQTDDSADGSGAVYVFVRQGEDWVQQAYLKGYAKSGGAQFGRALTLTDDLLVVGAPSDSHGGAGINPPADARPLPGSGSVHVFRRRDGHWKSEAHIKASDAAAGDLFGSAVALCADVLAVGAYLEDSEARDSGAVYLFAHRAGKWTETVRLKAPTVQAGAGFGYALALSTNTLAVGAHLEDGGERTAANINFRSSTRADMSGGGAVHIFSQQNGHWTAQARLRADTPAANDLFGASLALSGDTLAVGAHLEDGKLSGVSAENSGAVYIFERKQGVWSRQAYLKAEPGGSGHRFGRGLALNGDTLAVGASLEDGAGTGILPPLSTARLRDSGAVYLYKRDEQGWSQQAYIKASNTGVGDMFGYAIALFGGVLAVGAPNEASVATGINGQQNDRRAAGSGAVYLFQ